MEGDVKPIGRSLRAPLDYLHPDRRCGAGGNESALGSMDEAAGPIMRVIGLRIG
jgi:hypothetical protein